MFERAKTYAKITNLWSIARRYFVNNFYDGMLTVLGILLGFFVLILKGDQRSIDSYFVILTGVGSSISMLISGLTGSYLSEKAEQKKIKEELNRAMVITNSEEEEVLEDSIDVKEIEKAMLIKINHNVKLKTISRLRKKKKKIKTLQEKAENFTSIIVSMINGGSPFLGGLVPLIPFFLVPTAGISTFITSFFIILFCIILLGVFLGIVSKESIIKNILQMTFAFFITLLISIFLLG
ncbi:MAG: VIT1/CCC1 transporter family protein [Candidatus Lokiarchaeota archaeon]|nr:VIT1/CCC1 transporter family protein [Candidatus Lokiarchaeota archaeon]